MMSEQSNSQHWADLLETYGCNQFAQGLRQGSGIGPQFESLGSLNGFHLDNPWERAVSALIQCNLRGASVEEARRSVDTTLTAAGLYEVAPGERDVLAQLLTEGILT